MIIFESRKTKHVSEAGESFAKLFGLSFDGTNKENEVKLKEGIRKRVDLNLYSDSSNLKLYFYKPEAYFHSTHLKEVAEHFLFLSSKGVDLTLESDSINFINYFGQQIERGLVSKDDFKVRLEIEKDGSPYFLDLEYDDNGVLNGKVGEHFPIGYFN
jgi:hypothetical protein